MAIKPIMSRAFSFAHRTYNSDHVQSLPVRRQVLPDVVMIVDPNPVRLGELSNLAQSRGMRVLAFSNAHAALTWLSEKPIPTKVMMAWSTGSWASEKLSSLLSICRADFMIYARNVDAIPEKFKRYALATVPLGENLKLLIDHLVAEPEFNSPVYKQLA